MKPIERMAALRRDVWKTTAGLLVLTVAGASVAFGYGRLHFDLPIDWGRVLTLTGLLLTGWGTYFALHDNRATINGVQPDEVLRRDLFRWTFLPGLFLSIIGVLM